MQQQTATESEREMVHDYVLGRAIDAFQKGDDDEAFKLNRFAEALADMTDGEYDERYPEDDSDIA